MCSTIRITCFKIFWKSFQIIKGMDKQESDEQGSTVIKFYTPIAPLGSGAVTKEDFEKLFADTPTVSDNHINSEMTKLEAGLSDPKTDWSKHLILVGGAVYRSCDVTTLSIVTIQNQWMVSYVTWRCHYVPWLVSRVIHNAVSLQVKDLRSQVLRETCGTIRWVWLV